MIMNKAMKLAIVVLAVPALAVILLTSTAASTRAQGDDIPGMYKAKCAMCHGAKAEKSFDASKADEVLVDAVIKGVKPKMPSYDQKLTPEQAKALVSFMKAAGK
jgi:cytochrome c5